MTTTEPPRPPVVILCRPVDWSRRPPGGLANPFPEPPKPTDATVEDCARCGNDVYVESQEAAIKAAVTTEGAFPVLICYTCSIFTPLGQPGAGTAR